MRPWVFRALVMTAVFGVGQAAYVAARAWAPDLGTLWTVLFLGVLLGVGVIWAGTEVITERVPEEWSWFRAALASAPSAGVLSWALLALFVDGTGVADLGAALVGRAAFTALLIMGSTFVGTRLGWLSLRRRGEGDGDPMLDRDETDPEEIAAMAASGAARRPGAPVLAPSTVERVARRRRAQVGAEAWAKDDAWSGDAESAAYREGAGLTGARDAAAGTDRTTETAGEPVTAKPAPDVPAEATTPTATTPTATTPTATTPTATTPTTPTATTPTATTPTATPTAPRVASTTTSASGAGVESPGSPAPSSPRAASPVPASPAADTFAPISLGGPTPHPSDRSAEMGDPGPGSTSEPAAQDEPDDRPEPDLSPDTRFAPPVVAVLPPSDPRFGRSAGGDDHDVAGDTADDRGHDDSSARGTRRSVAEAARAARLARAQAQRDDRKAGDDKRRKGTRRRPGR